jgi:SAM-dependent methyltransferase
VVDGIPVLLAGYGDSDVLQLLADDPEQAISLMLGLDDERQEAFKGLLARGSAATYREFIELMYPGVEGPYFVHRFANPTYLVGQTVLRALGGDRRCFARRAIDLCGGLGHMARALCQLSGGAEVLLTEGTFWKLWLAKRITAPECVPVCCDAEAPLPFKPHSFSLALCSDAFHYIWSKRLFAGEMMRLVGDDGVVVLNHLHNALQENYSTGLPLAPKWWRNLFAELGARVFKESEVLDSVLEYRQVDLSHDYTDEELAGEQALLLIATKLAGLFRVYDYPGAQLDTGLWRINPLYEVERVGGSAVLRLRFPDRQYEDEFKACKRYLPAQLEVTDEALRKLSAGEIDAELYGLAECYVALSVPKGYL